MYDDSLFLVGGDVWERFYVWERLTTLTVHRKKSGAGWTLTHLDFCRRGADSYFQTFFAWGESRRLLNHKKRSRKESVLNLIFGALACDDSYFRSLL